MIRRWLRSGKGCDGISRGIAPVSRRQLIPPLRRLRRFCHLCQSPLTSSRKRSSASAVVLFQSYEMQVAALLAAPGDPTPRIDIAWNTNLAYLQADTWSEHRCRPGAMRDTDIGWETKIVAATGGQVATFADLRSHTLALGSRDSGHAAILPVYFLERGKCQAQLKIVANRRRCWFSLSKARRTAAKDSTSGKMSGVTSISASVAPTGCQ